MAQRVGRGIALLFHDRGTRRDEWSAARLGRTLLPGKTGYPLYRRLGGPQGRSGWAENLFPIGIRSRNVQPTEMSTRIIFGGKGGRCLGLITLPLSHADCLEILEPQPPGALRACRRPVQLLSYLLHYSLCLSWFLENSLFKIVYFKCVLSVWLYMNSQIGLS